METPVSRLAYDFFDVPCVTLARQLLGKIIARKLDTGEVLRGRIVETESYLGTDDVASHSYNGRKTPRNEAMFMNPGTAYIYSIYGMYFCFNISSQEEGSAVLIRAVEPMVGFETMRQFRSARREDGSNKLKTHQLCNGPSKLCQAFCIRKEKLNKTDLCDSCVLWLENSELVEDSRIIACKRIGIDSAGPEWANKPLRFYILGSMYVSAKNKSVEKALVT